MTISRPVWIALAVSVGVALVICFSAWFIMRKKIKKIRKQQNSVDRSLNSINNKALERKDSGELLWELKNQSINPLEDVQLEFLLNTAIRNAYKTFSIIGSQSDYEEKSFKKIAKMKKGQEHSDLVVLFNDEKINKTFDINYKKLRKNQMIAIVNAPRKDKEIKTLLRYLKTIKAKYDIITFGKGIILVVK